MQLRLIFFICGTLYWAQGALAQFEPAAGKPGSSAVHKDDTLIKTWAVSCMVQRGLMQANQPDSGYASSGNANSAIGKAGVAGVVSLGDGGMATLTFNAPIYNGVGYDFVVFENAFSDTFLELAFVEVSSDGIHFIRFPSISLTDTTSQTGAFDATYPEKIYQLAGKYRAPYGVPFDLETLKDSPQLNIQFVSHVRIVDVVGSIIDSLASRDGLYRKINDPWPTLFPSSGFDLDAVGVRYALWDLSAPSTFSAEKHLYPNPCAAGSFVKISSPLNNSTNLFWIDALGRKFSAEPYANEGVMAPKNKGNYILYIVDHENVNTYRIWVN